MVLSRELKLSICFGLIFGVIFSICGLCFATENEDIEVVTPSILNGANLSGSGLITTSTNQNVYYINLEAGYTYTLTNEDGAPKYYGLSTSDSINIGDTIDTVSQIPANSSIEVNYSSGFLIVCTSSSKVSFSRLYTGDGLDDFVGSIAYQLSFDNLGEVIVIVVPILAISVLFGLGFYFIKRILNKAKRAKGGV